MMQVVYSDNISNINNCYNACRTFYVNSFIRVLMLLLGLSIYCHHLHPHPPNM